MRKKLKPNEGESEITLRPLNVVLIDDTEYVIKSIYEGEILIIDFMDRILFESRYGIKAIHDTD